EPVSGSGGGCRHGGWHGSLACGHGNRGRGSELRRVTVGLAQMDCQLGQVASNIEKMGRFVEQAAAQGVQLLCFPELATTGYNPQLLGDRFAQLALTGDGPELAPLREAAREHDMWLLVPMAERRTLPGLPYNSAVVIDPQGRVAGSYAKAHL